jgi:tetratricopeptide (TPR) repeat protein
MSKRLLYLEKVTSEGTADSFAWYALALEYDGQGRVDDAVATFDKLREKDPSYVPMYLMCGSMLAKAGRNAEAKEWLELGEKRAGEKGDSKALGEIRDALAKL